MRRYKYGGSGIVNTIGSLLVRYATKAMLATATQTTMRGTLDVTKRAVSHLIAYKVASTIADVAKKRKRVDIDVKHSQEPQLKKAFVSTGGIDINALIDGSGIVLANKMIGESILELHGTNATITIFQFEVNIGWTDGGICPLSWTGYITSRFGELFIDIYQRLWSGERLVSRYQHQCSC